MELDDIPKDPSSENLGVDLWEYETLLLFKCCGAEFDNALITDDNGYDGDFCPKCEADDPSIVRRVV